MVKLRGNTLVEAMVAVVIIIFCMTVAAGIYVKVVSNLNATEKMRAFYISKECIRRSVSGKKYLDEAISVQGFKVEKTCSPYKGSSGLIKIEVRVKNESDKIVWEEKQVLINE